jgi:hypothetical protein
MTQSLDVLVCKETLRRLDDLPTWTPNWSCSVLEKFRSYIGRNEKFYNATQGLKLTIKNLKYVAKLGLEEIYIDTVTIITTGLVDNKLTGMLRICMDIVSGWWVRAYSFVGLHYSYTNERLAQALGHTRLVDGHGENEKIGYKAL